MPFVLPLPIDMLALFISHLDTLRMAPSSISSLSAISYIHELNNWANPTNAFLVQKIVAGCYKKAPSFEARLTITKLRLSNQDGSENP